MALALTFELFFKSATTDFFSLGKNLITRLKPNAVPLPEPVISKAVSKLQGL